MAEPERILPDTLEETEAVIARVEEDLAIMDGKMDNAKAIRLATGQYADPAWWARIKSRRRFEGQWHQRLLRHAAQLRRGNRTSRIESAFMDAARRLLEPDTFARLLDEAREDVHG